MFRADSISAADVSLTRNMSYFRRVNSNGIPKITYLHLYECEAFSVCLFAIATKIVLDYYQLENLSFLCAKVHKSILVPTDRHLLFASKGCHSSP